MIKLDKNKIRKIISRGIVILFVALAFSCGIMLLVDSLYKESKMMKLEIKMKKEKIAAQENFILKLTDFRIKDVKEISGTDLDKVDRLVLNRDDYEGYLAAIIHLAQINNVVIDGFSVSFFKDSKKIKISEDGLNNENSENKLKETEISFSASGNFAGLSSFLKSLENKTPLIDEQSLTITREGEESNESEERMICNLQIKFYYY